MCRVLQDCQWSGLGRRCPARPHSALTWKVLSYPTFEKAKVNYRGQISFLPPKEGEGKKKTFSVLMERKNRQTQDTGNCSFNS